MQATIQGCDIVCPSPIATAPSRYASLRISGERKRSRGTSAIARNTHASSMPRRRSCRSTIRWRAASVDVVPERVRLMHHDLAAAGGDQPRPLQLREEAAGALARRARELGDLGLGRAHEHVAAELAVGAKRLDLAEQGARDAAGDRLERLPRDPLVRRAQAVGETLEHLQADLRVAHDEAAQVGREDPERAHRLEHLDGGAARLAAEHRELAEDRSGAQLAQRDHAAVGVAARDASGAGADNEAGVARVALAEHDLTGL